MSDTTHIHLPDVPLPGDTFDGGTILASAWNKYDPCYAPSVTFIVQRPSHPVYVVVGAVVVDDEWTLDSRVGFEYVVEAVHRFDAEVAGLA